MATGSVFAEILGILLLLVAVILYLFNEQVGGYALGALILIAALRGTPIVRKWWIRLRHKRPPSPADDI